MVRRKTRAINVRSHTCNGPRIKHGVNTAFNMVGHDQPAKLQTSTPVTFRKIIPQLHLGVIVFQVAVIAVGTNVAPFAQNRVTQITLMPFVRIPPNNRIVYLAPDPAIRPNGSSAINLRPHLHLRVFINSKPTAYISAFPNLGVFPQVYRPVYSAESAALRIGTVFSKKAVANNGIGAAHGFTGATFCQ